MKINLKTIKRGNKTFTYWILRDKNNKLFGFYGCRFFMLNKSRVKNGDGLK